MAETSYNGWPASPDPAAIGIVDFGDAYGLPFPGGVKGGDVHKVLGYVASQFHYRVESVVAGWDWGYSYRANVNNPAVLSCHSSGTALDINAPLHPNGVGGTFTSAQVVAIREILAECGGAVDWLEGYDEMHFEIAVDAGTLAGIAATLPGPGPAPEPEPDDDEHQEDDDMLIIGAEGVSSQSLIVGDRCLTLPDSTTADGLRAAGVRYALVSANGYRYLQDQLKAETS